MTGIIRVAKVIYITSKTFLSTIVVARAVLRSTVSGDEFGALQFLAARDSGKP